MMAYSGIPVQAGPSTSDPGRCGGWRTRKCMNIGYIRYFSIDKNLSTTPFCFPKLCQRNTDRRRDGGGTRGEQVDFEINGWTLRDVGKARTRLGLAGGL